MNLNLKIGDNAPEFTGKNQDGQEVSLSSYKGNKVVLYFYPKDDTPGCTRQGCSLRDNYETFAKLGYKILGISSDSAEKHKKFINKYNFQFDLIADVDHSIHDLYGTWVQKSFLGKKYWGTARVTFIIDEQGKIEKIITDVDTKKHADQILAS
jgi:peroxiredoxin Q/BCP